MSDSRIPLFSTKPEALKYLKPDHPQTCSAVSWRQKGGGENKGKLMVATLVEGKVQVGVYNSTAK